MQEGWGRINVWEKMENDLKRWFLAADKSIWAWYEPPLSLPVIT